MKTLNSRGSALVSAATLALVLSFSAIADQAKEQSKATKKIKSSQQVMVNTINLNLTTQQGNFAAAREKGLTMLGYKDVQGLKRIIGSILKDTAKSNSELSAALEKAAGNNGVDADAIKEMSGLLRGGFGPIDRIEFVPGWDGAERLWSKLAIRWFPSRIHYLRQHVPGPRRLHSSHHLFRRVLAHLRILCGQR
jgi:hypothetical protein